MIVVNFKTYEQGSGEQAVSLAQKLAVVSQQSIIPVVVAVPAIDLKEVIDGADIGVWVQNIDPITYGAHTGMTLAEEAKRIGAQGTLLNHSENKYSDLEKLQYAVTHAKTIGLKTLVFASTLEELTKVLAFQPDYVSYEPPSLIGSTTTSVAQAEPDIIKKAVEIATPFNIPLIVGAGIHSSEDVKVSVALGAKGVAVATDIVKATDPQKELKELLQGFE